MISRCTDTIEPSRHVRVLGVIISSDLSLEKHVSAVSATCFFHLRQIRRVRQSLDVGSAKTLVQAFVTSRVDYCNAVLAKGRFLDLNWPVKLVLTDRFA